MERDSANPISEEQVYRSTLMNLRVVHFRAEARDVVSIELALPSGAPLPKAEAGAHIDVHLPNGMIRQYSLINMAAQTDRYHIAVAKGPHSRGGSVYIHEMLRVG